MLKTRYVASHEPQVNMKQSTVIPACFLAGICLNE